MYVCEGCICGVYLLCVFLERVSLERVCDSGMGSWSLLYLTVTQESWVLADNAAFTPNSPKAPTTTIFLIAETKCPYKVLLVRCAIKRAATGYSSNGWI